MMQKIEICCGSLQSGIVAQKAGAQRIELCSSLDLGGLTPSYGEIFMARKNLTIDINVLIRPRQGDFLYSNSEIDVMLADIEMCAKIGVAGVVIGALDKYGNIDVNTTKLLADTAKKQGMSVTFHRAIDVSSDIFNSLKTILGIDIDRVLTSGGKKSAKEGISAIKIMQQTAAGQIIIMPGSGVNNSNIVEIIEKTGVKEIHFTGSEYVKSQMQFKHSTLNFTPQALGGDYIKKETTILKLSEIMETLKNNGLLP